jgi:nucleotide sugar dehydrogenase
MKNILIAGYGNVGHHLGKELNGLKYDIYDKFISEYENNIKNKYDIAFVCVPTEMTNDGSACIKDVEEVVANIKSDIICIKSAVPVGTAEYLHNKYDKNIVISPEFWGATSHALSQPNFLILGGSKKDCRIIAQLYQETVEPNYTFHFTNWKTAELVKYMENSFLALKVTFCNEFSDIASYFGVSYPELRELFVLDPRIGKSHTFVYPEKPYYDSHCLNKDIPAIIKQVPNKITPLMQAINKINHNKKSIRL